MIKLHENFKPKYNTIVDNLKREVAEWSDENSEIFESVVASVITGTPIYDVGQEEVDYTNKYKKETLKASLQNYVLNQLNYGVDNRSRNFL